MSNSNDILDLKPKTFSKFYKFTMDGDAIPKGSNIGFDGNIVDKNGRMIDLQEHFTKAKLVDTLED